MAVEARHLNLFQPRLIQDREMLNSINQGNTSSIYNSHQIQMGFLGVPFAAALPQNQSFHHQEVCESVPAKSSINTDSGLTYNISALRKRSRDCFNPMYANQSFAAPQKHSGVSQLPSYAGEDVFPQIHQYQFEIEAIISQHAKKIKMELEERQKQQARLLEAAMGERVMKKLKAKDDQIQRMGKMNFVLEERVKSLYVENQLWRDLARTNEATANSLRTNLEQILLHVGSEERRSAGAGGGASVEDDAESCCGSRDRCRDEAQEERSCYSYRKCKMCGERESGVLLLPCRHLCLCNVCGSGSHQIKACPVCNSSMNATLHVNMSS